MPSLYLLPGATSVTIPSNWPTGAVYNIDCLGAAGNGGSGAAGVGGGYGGGGGAFSRKRNFTLVPGTTYNVQVPTGGTAQTTIFDTSLNTCVADYGRSASGTTGGVGGLTANSVGDILLAGATGGNSGNLLSGGGGGGAASINGAGVIGGTASGTNSGAGGNSGSALAGGAAVGVTTPGNAGGNGTEYDASHGSGSGGSGGGGISAVGASEIRRLNRSDRP